MLEPAPENKTCATLFELEILAFPSISIRIMTGVLFLVLPYGVFLLFSLIFAYLLRPFFSRQNYLFKF